jgi:5-amino-6-(5-phosphoribosylamino)uracil reductase
MNRPYTTVVLAMTADGKIADKARSPARFSSAADKAHLEKQISLVDGVIFGANTLRAYGTTLPISNPQLLQARQELNKPPQPVHIVCSASAKIDPELRFFSQPVPRWLLTTSAKAKSWQGKEEGKFDRIIVAESHSYCIDWIEAFEQLTRLGLKKLAILGGGKLVASLLEKDLIDELWLTVCPIIFGGVNSPTPVEGSGFLFARSPRLELLSVETVEQEVFLHYRLSS